jgi:3-oxoacyl-[acyl-carrier-protein] synthase III
MRYAQILSTGRYVPERVMTNAELDALFPERDIDGWLRANVGIEERHLMAEAKRRAI